jgi:iron complex transport system substrate-binding protein
MTRHHAQITLALFLAALCLLVGCAPKSEEPTAAVAMREVTDCLDRRVVLPAKIERVVCIGAGALRLYCYVGEVEDLVGVEACEKSFLFSFRPYQDAHKELFRTLPTIGSGGPGGTLDPEALLACRPQVIFSTFYSSPREMEKLQRDTGIPVVVLHYGTQEVFDPMVDRSLEILGTVLNRQPRATEVRKYIQGLQSDLERRTAGIPETERPRVYLAGHPRFGLQGFGSTLAHSPLLQALHAKNAVDELPGGAGPRRLTLEEVLTLDPQVVFLDDSATPIVQDEFQKRPEVFRLMTAIRDGRIHRILPYNAYYTNLEMAYADGYLMGKALYPSAFQDVDPRQKAAEIAEFLLGVPVEIPWPEDTPILP